LRGIVGSDGGRQHRIFFYCGSRRQRHLQAAAFGDGVCTTRAASAAAGYQDSILWRPALWSKLNPSFGGCARALPCLRLRILPSGGARGPRPVSGYESCLRGVREGSALSAVHKIRTYSRWRRRRRASPTPSGIHRPRLPGISCRGLAAAGGGSTTAANTRPMASTSTGVTTVVPTRWEVRAAGWVVPITVAD